MASPSFCTQCGGWAVGAGSARQEREFHRPFGADREPPHGPQALPANRPLPRNATKVVVENVDSTVEGCSQNGEYLTIARGGDSRPAV